MKILITGCNGQLGTAMRWLSAEHSGYEYIWTDIDNLDLTDREAVKSLVEKEKVDIIVNCAAFTNVDGAEQNETAARMVNSTAVENLALTGRRIIHISTDYVFSGEGFLPYRESDTPQPRTVYGRTKLEGEEKLHQLCPDAIIIRTAWLYSPVGKNFVKTMLNAAEVREELKVVYDQIGTPTYAVDLARVIYAFIGQAEWKSGIYHFTNEGVCSWYDFTVEILRQARLLTSANRFKAKVLPIRSVEYQYATARPHYSVLDKKKIKQTLSIDIPYWTDSLNECLVKLLNER